MQMLGSRGDEGGFSPQRGGGDYGSGRTGESRDTSGGESKKDAGYGDREEPPFNPDDDIPF